jgi:hypothetical protein
MKLTDFKDMWQGNGAKLVEVREAEQKDTLWKLFSVIFPSSTQEYGRHTGLILAVDKKSGEIIGHEISNEYGEGAASWNRIDDWFNRHVMDGIGNVL